MTTHIDPQAACADMAYLHPSCWHAFVQLEDYLKQAYTDKKTVTLFVPFETYRHPARQRMLFNNGKGVTRAKQYQSAHQFGMAVDYVPFETTFSWAEKHDYGFLRAAAPLFGLTVPYAWDKCHVEHPRFNWIREDVARI